MNALSTLWVLSLSATAASAWEIVIPPQVISRWTHYPTWRTPDASWDPEQFDTVTIFSIIGVLIGLVLVLQYEIMVKKPHIKTIDDTCRSNSRIFSTVISYYLIATFFAVFSFWVLDLGKLWSTVGALHNLLEVTVLFVMAFKRYPAGFKYFYPLLFFYLLATEWACLILHWPYDAIFFKFQGLATDIGLAINFTRLYRENKLNPITDAEPSRDPTDDVDEETPLLNSDNSGNMSSGSSRRHILGTLLPNGGRSSHSSDPAAGVGHPSSQPTTQSDFAQTPIANNIRILVAAASIHVIGNTIATFWDTFFPFLIFQFSYAIAYPLYGYYVALVPDDSRIRWFSVSVFSETLVGISSVVLSMLVVGFGAFLSLSKYQKHDFAVEY